MTKMRKPIVREPILGTAKPTLEARARKRARRGQIERIVLGVLLFGGMLTIAMMAPKLLQLIKSEHLDYVLPKDPKQRLCEVMCRLRRKGLVVWKERNGKRYPVITESGRRHLRRLTLEGLRIHKPRRWDERWRIVIFDIRQNERAVRDKVRGMLKRLGFMRLQGSVWVHPYDCEEVIALLKTELRSGTSVLYIIADAIEYDAPLREHFGLPPQRR